MSFTIVNVEQRSSDWFAARLGRVTGSTATAILSKGRGGEEAVGRKNLRVRLALERVTGKSLEKQSFQTDAMKQGVEREPLAIAAYEAHAGVFLERTGFCRHDDLMIGCSLDASIADFSGLVSVKCPELPAHLDTWRTRTIPKAYMDQIIHEQLVTGAQWTDYVSFNPDFPEDLALCVIRVERDKTSMDAYALALSLFLSEVEAEVKNVEALRGGR